MKNCPECKADLAESLTLALDYTMYFKVRPDGDAFTPSEKTYPKLGLLERFDDAIRDGDKGDERLFCECGYYFPTFKLTVD